MSSPTTTEEARLVVLRWLRGKGFASLLDLIAYLEAEGWTKAEGRSTLAGLVQRRWIVKTGPRDDRAVSITPDGSAELLTSEGSTTGISLELAEVLADLVEAETTLRFSPAKMAPLVVEVDGALEVGDDLRFEGITIARLEAELARRDVAARTRTIVEEAGIPERFAELEARREFLHGPLDGLVYPDARAANAVELETFTVDTDTDTDTGDPDA